MIEIVTSCISGFLTLLGVIVTCLTTSRKTNNSICINQAVTDTKLDDLTREVRMHNKFIQQIPVFEEQIKGINYRIKDIEQNINRK
ncbi:MAG: hypothetical protein Q4B04_03920 [bacterium]|nr:hypothetical protein [bacterium]